MKRIDYECEKIKSQDTLQKGEHYILPVPSTSQSLIQVNQTLDFLELVGRLRQLSRKQALTGSQYFQIGSISVLHQKRCTGIGTFQCSNLMPVILFLLAGLIRYQRVVHFRTGIQQLLAESQKRFFLLCLGDTTLSDKGPPVKQRLGK